MAERYSRLYALPENQYTAGAPVLIAAGALLKDNQTGKALVQIKFRSISEKQIKAVKISVAAFDVSGKELEGVAEYQYLDLNMGRNTEFGQKQAVTLPNAVTRSFVAKCTDVFFADGSAWSADSDAAWKFLPAQATVAEKLGNLAAQYQRDTSTGSKFVPAEHEDLWFCSCGALNHNEEAKCHNCKQEKEKLFAALDLDGLQQRNEAYKVEKAEIAEIKRKNATYSKARKLMVGTQSSNYQEAIEQFESILDWKDSSEQIVICRQVIAELEEKKERERQETEIKAIRNKKIARIVVPLVVVGLGFAIVWCTWLHPLMQYNKALSLIESKQYNEAVAIFTGIADFRDSAERVNEENYPGNEDKIREAKYQYVQAHMMKENGHTYSYLKELVEANYKDSEAIFNELYKWKATLLCANTDPDDATTIVKTISKKVSYFHFALQLYGGEPGAHSNFYLEVRWPNGDLYKADWCWENMSSGHTLSASFTNGFTTQTGTMMLDIYEKGTNELVTTFQVKVE